MWPACWAFTDRMSPFRASSPAARPRSPRSLSRVLRPAVLAAALASVLHVPVAWAVDPFTLKDIRVEGLQRADAGTIFGALPFRIGDTYNDEKGAAALRALFATGLFKDVRLEVDGDVVVVVVEERPIIQTVEFIGLKEFDKDALTKSLKDVGIGQGLPFDRALADRAEQELKRQYLTRSLYGAEVVTTITPVERNRVNVSFTVTEGEVAKIGEIRVTGNKVFSEGTLLGQFELTSSGWLTWYTKTDRYSRRCAPTTSIGVTSSSTSTRRRLRSRPTSSAFRSTSTSPKASPTRSRASSSRATFSARRTSSSRWS